MPYAAILPITKADTMSETFIHPSSFVDDGAVIGPGCRIWHFSHIMAGAVLGPACNIGQNVMVAADVKLGRQVKVQNNVSIYSGVICEDYVFLGLRAYSPTSRIPEARSRAGSSIKPPACAGAPPSGPMPPSYAGSRSAGTPSWARERSLRTRSPIMPSLRGCPHAWSDG